MKQFKRAIALLLVLVLVLSIFPSAVAAGTEDVPQGTLEPTNFPAEYGDLYIQWNRLSNAQYYTVQLYKHQGDGEQYVLLYSETLTASQVTTSPYKLDVTDWIKSYGAGDYMANIVIERKYTTPTKASIEMTVTQLATPTGVSVSTDGVVTWNQVTGNHGYEVTVTVGDQSQTYKVDQNKTSVDASEFIQGFAGSTKAQTVSASVKAYGNLGNEYRTVDSAFSAPATTLPEKVGVLPTPVIANSNVVSEGSKLYVEYKLEPGSVDASYIDEITLTLTGKETKASATYTVAAANVIAVGETGRIDVTRLGSNNLPHDTYTAVFNATPKYPDLNQATSSTGEVTYSVKQALPAPVLSVDDAGTVLSWEQVQLSAGKLDSTSDYTVEYMKTGETEWKTVSVDDSNAIKMDADGKLYVDISGILVPGVSYDFKVIATNLEDLTYEESSASTITIFKTNAVSEVKIDATTHEDAVYATWNNPTVTTGIDKYQVDVYVGDEVVKTFYTADASAEELNISEAIDAAAKKTYTVKVTAIGEHDLRPTQALFYADSAAAAGTGSVTSGTVKAADIVFETPEGASTTYKVYFNGEDNEADLPENVEGYAVTISYKLKNGGTGSWSGTLNVPFCDIAQLENADGNKFLLASWNVYVDATFTVEATALSNNTALHANAEPKTETDVFSLTPISELLKPRISTDASGRTWVTWEAVEGAKEYAVEVQMDGSQLYKGFENVNKANITGWLSSAGEYTVTVTAYPYEGSTAFVTGSASVTVTVLAAPAEVTITRSDDTAIASWSEVANASYYLVTVKKDGAAITDYENVQVEDTSYVLTDIIKANGAGTYTVEVTAVGDGSKYITSLVPGTAKVSISELTTPTVTYALNRSKEPVVTITANPDETVSSYTVYLYANDELFATLTDQKAGDIDVTANVAGYKSAKSAVELSAEVEAVGRLEDGTLSSSVFGSATLDRKAGLLPSIAVSHTQIVQENGMLKVKYQLTDTGVGLDAISRLTLILKAKSGSASYTFHIDQPTSAEGYFDVTRPDGENVLPAGEYQATIAAYAAYPALNTATKVTNHPMSYAVNTLPAPGLQVSADGARLYWEAIPMSDGKAIDEVSEFTLKVWKNDEAAWVSEAVANQIKYDEDEGVFYVSLASLLKNYTKYQITAANNGEDVSYTSSSVAEITISKLADVSDVKISMDTKTDTVVAKWTAPASTTGLATYQVELLVQGADGTYSVAKTYTTGDTSFTFPDDAIDQTKADTYKVRVTAIGVHGSVVDGSVASGDVETAFVADSEPVESASTVASGSVPSAAETGTIYEENGTLYLKVELEDVNNTFNKIEKITLTSLTDGNITYSKAVNGDMNPVSGGEKAYVIFDLSKMYGQGKLTSGVYTATIEVTSVCEQLNASATAESKAKYQIAALDMGALRVNSETGEITWDALKGAAGYNVLVSYDLGQTTSNWVASTSAQDNIFSYNIQDVLATDKTLEPGRVYTVTVTAYSDTAMTNPTGASSSVQVCKLTAPTDPAVSVDSTKATASWTLSTLNNCKDNYLVSVVAADGTSYSNTTKGKTINLNSAKLLSASSAAPAGAYTVTVQTKAKVDVAVDGVYYVDSDTVTAAISAYKGTLPADKISNVSVSWGANSSLMLNYQLPVATGVTDPFELALIKAIDYDNIQIEVSYGNTVIGKYTGTASADTGVGTVDITKATEGALKDQSIGSLYAGEDISVKFTLASNYVLIKGASTTAEANIPDQGVIGFDDFNVDVTDGKVTFTGDPNATSYTAELKDASGKKTPITGTTNLSEEIVYTFDVYDNLTAGETYTLTITGKDATGQYKDGVKEIKLYKLEDPTGLAVDPKTAAVTYTSDDTEYTYTPVVTSDDGAAYSDGVMSFAPDAALHTANVSVALNGGYDSVNDVYVLNAANDATVSVITGKYPNATLTSLTTNASGNATAVFTFDLKGISQEAWKYAATNMQIGGSTGIIVKATAGETTVVCNADSWNDGTVSIDKNAGTLTANFGINKTLPLASGYIYSFEVTTQAKSGFRGVLFASTNDAGSSAYDVNKLSISPSVSATGAVSFNMTDEDKAALDYVEVTYNGTTKQIKEGANLYNLFGIPADNYSTLKFTFQAIAKDGSREDSDVTQPVSVRRLRAVTATLNESGKFSISNPNGTYGTYSVKVTGAVSGSKNYTKPANNSSYLEGATWKTGPFQTLTAVTTTTGGEYNGVYCLSNSEKPATTTTFSVGTLPAVTLGNALEKNGDGKWVIKYTLDADESYYESLKLTLTVEDPTSTGTTAYQEVTGANGEFNVNDFVMSNPGTYSYTLEVVAANETLNSVSTDKAYTGPDSYSYVVGQLDEINAQVDTVTGKITWNSVDHATSYTVSEVLSSNTQLVQTIQANDALEFIPADLTAGVLRTFVIAATSTDPQYPGTSTATVKLYKLVDPTGAAINAKTGELTFTGDTTADDAGYSYVPSVKLSDENASYEDGIVKFDLNAALQEVTTQVYLVGGADNGSNGLYLIQSSGCAEVKTVTGAMPTATLQSVTKNTDGTTSVVFQLNVDASSDLWKAAYPNVQAGGASGIYVTAKTDSGSTIVCYDKNSYTDPDIDFTTRTATITATFGLSGNNLTDGVAYTFSVRVPVKTAYKAVFGPTTTENLTDSTPTATKLEVSASVGVDGALTVSEKNGNTNGVKAIWMEVGTPSQKVAVFENGAQTVSNVLAQVKGQTTLTFYAEAADARYEDSDRVTVTVVPMDAPEITFTENGYFTVSADANGTLEVKLNGSSVTADTNGQYSYAEVVSNATEPAQLNVAATLTGKTVSDTNTTYLSSSATAQSDFYVGPLPTLVHGSTTTEIDTSETKLVLAVDGETQLWDMIDWASSSATIADPADPEHPFTNCTIAHNDADHTVTITWNAAMSEGDKVVTVSLASLNGNVAKATVSTVEFTFVLDQYPDPVIVPGQDGKLSIDVPDGAVLAADLGDGKWVAVTVTDTEDLLAWLDTVIEDNDTSLHEVQFKFVDETVTLSMDGVPADSAIVTLKVQRLTAPTVNATATDGTFTVTNPNPNATGKLSVKVDGTDVTSENATYTVPETIHSGPFTVTAQAQVETNPVNGVYYLDSAVTEANGTKAGTPLDAPVGKITVSKRTIYWNDVENAVSYEVWIDGVKDEDAEFDTTVNGESTNTYTMDLSVGVHEVQIVAVPEANKGYQSTASEVYHVTQLPDMVSAAVNKATGVVTFEVDEYDAAATDLPETNPYGHCRVNVAFSPKTSGSWNSTEKTATYTTTQDATLTYLRVSVGGASFKDEAGVQQYHLTPKTYAQNTEKFYIGQLPAFTLESVVENDNNTTTVTFVTKSEEDLESILNLEATIATFAYSFESLDEPAMEGSWEHTADQISAQVDGNKLIFTLETPTSAGFELTYSFTAKPAVAVAAVRSEMESTGTIEYKGNKLSAPTGLKMEIVNGEPVLVWNAVEGAQGYKVQKNTETKQTCEGLTYKPSIDGVNVPVTYSVYAVGKDGVTDDSEAATITLKKVDNSIVTDFTLRSPAVSLSSQRVNYTMTTTNANLKRVLAFTTDNEAVTITHTTDTATTYDVAYSGDTFAEVKLNAYICGEYKDVWYYSPTVMANGTFIVGPVASNATVSSVTMNKAGSVVVTLSFDGINSSAIDFTQYSCTMTGEDGTPVAATSRSLSGKTLKLTFKTGVVEGNYKLDLTLPVKAAYAENAMLQGYTVSIDTVNVPANAG